MILAAEVKWWIWDAVAEIAPGRLTFPRPKRPRGRDANVNRYRDMWIWTQVCIHLEVGRRVEGRGPSYVKLGKGRSCRVLYKGSAVLAWLEEQTVRPDGVGRARPCGLTKKGGAEC